MLKKLYKYLPSSFFNKEPKLSTLFLIPISIFSIQFIIAPFVKVISPSTYNFCLGLLSQYGMALFTYPVLAWLIGLIFFYILELYFYLYFQLEIEKNVIPNYLPNIIQNWLQQIKHFAEAKDIELRKANIHLFLVPLTFLIIVTILFAYVAIFYLNEIKLIV